MKKGIQSNIPEFFFSGKSILIIIVILISGFSFSLGYLVGKKSDSFSDRKLVERKADVPPVPPPVSPDEFDRTVDAIIKQDLEISGNVEHPANGKAELTKLEAPTSASPRKTDNTIYSIQVGAFKRLSDAERLKTRLDNNGFSSYILTVKLKKGTLYKVRAGRYDERSEAEEYASDIKKMKGLDAFVLIER
jgi:cell division protein FtsN